MNNKLVYATIGILVVLAGIFACINMNLHSDAPVKESIKVIIDGNAVGEIAMDDIKKLPAVTKKVTIRSSSEGVGNYNFTGTPLRKVLESVSPGVRLAGRKVTAKGIDSFNVLFEGQEILSSEKVLLVYARDDQPLGSKAKGGTGPFRIIILGDQFGLRAVKYVYELEVN
jgi:DMSO/TMAO reductase YedYZ molybdopterin-dependent catalytic subunit